MKTNTSTQADKINVLFVHGIFSNSYCFWLMKKRALKRGWNVYTIDLKKADGRASISELSDQIEGHINTKLSSITNLHLVGFSMGGLALKELLITKPNLVNKIKSLTTIGTPHEGSYWANNLNRLPGGRDLMPNSKALEKQSQFDWESINLPVLNCWTNMDIAVVPAISSKWNGQRNVNFTIPYHSNLLLSPHVFRVIAKFVESNQRKANKISLSRDLATF